MKNLAEIIKANPGCVAIVDNDSWTLHREHPYENGPNEDDDDEAYEAFEKWQEENQIARSGEVEEVGGGYGSGNCYGGDILQALAQIAGVKVDSV